MGVWDGILLGLGVALQPHNVLFALLGCLVGTLVGVLPGLGPTATIAILMPLTFGLDPVTGLIALAGIYYGAQYGGSTTSILLRLPGEASSVVTALDGHAMTRNGRGGAALSIAALASFFAGTMGTLFMAAFAPVLVVVVLKFGAPEYFMLMFLGLITSVVLAQGSVIRALAMILVGLLLGMAGTDVNSGQYRYDFGFYELLNGVPFVPLVVGLFGIADILVTLERAAKDDAPPLLHKISSLWPWKSEMRRAAPAAARGTVVGLFLGLLPGGGALLSSFMAYSVEKRISKTPEKFGSGLVEGVAAPEAANNAGAQTAFLPLLTLGIPSNAIMALMVGAMMVHGIIPGPRVMTAQPDLFWGLIASMWVGNLMLLVINLPLVGIWVQLLRIRYHVMFPIILTVSAVGIYGVEFTTFDIYLTAIFGVLGYLMHKWRCEPAPLLLAFVLGPMMEEYFRRAMLVGRGDPMIFLTHPISAGMLVVAIILLISMIFPSIQSFRRKAFAE
ncbi:tripartite tricarboxylate transporter permease [Paracoccus shanxieyensis]|uniref:Tripartite tricarboxylate transporter permease n=1 Tax=Paracoccus shanxieyensis TaxID=2675752 RepID=A0A6L6J1Y9_9RHOB|nr:tripartite tricarboxylate transporter permease [Paracoccus shanxieyensis]MTH65422.1 tripartite tricarboxylate transporter permease [Paracoccus shanxieyensis]MTH88567.1 tripartite tricarboxylate transporter permease [Paracoccus shanxieyensis]